MFEFEYDFDAEMMIAASNFMLKKYLIALKIILPVIVSLSFLNEYLKTREIKSLITLIIFLPFCYFILFIASKLSNKSSVKNSGNAIGMRVNIQFTDSNIVVKTRKDNSFETSQEYEWKDIYKIVQNDLYYFVYLSKTRLYSIPKGSCISGNEVGFFQFAENKIKNI